MGWLTATPNDNDAEPNIELDEAVSLAGFARGWDTATYELGNDGAAGSVTPGWHSPEDDDSSLWQDLEAGWNAAEGATGRTVEEAHAEFQSAAEAAGITF